MDSRGNRVKRKLPKWNSHPPATLVAKAQDAFVVRDHDQADIFKRRIAEHLIDVSAIGRRDPDSTGPAKHPAVFLARLAHRRRIYDRKKLLNVVQQKSIEQHLIAILEEAKPMNFSTGSALGDAGVDSIRLRL